MRLAFLPGLAGIVLGLSACALALGGDDADDLPTVSTVDPFGFGHELPALFPPPHGRFSDRVPGEIVPRWQLVRNGFQSVQVNGDAWGNNIVGDAANEPSLAVDPNDPLRMVIGWRQFDSLESDFREAGWAYSNDGGQTWTFPGALQQDVFRSDPVVVADNNGTFFYYSMSDSNPRTCQLFTSTNGGMSWTGPVAANGGDKAWVAVDRTTGPGDGNLYFAWDYAGCCDNKWFCRARSSGTVVDPPVEIPLGPNFGTLTVGPDGELLIAGRRYLSTSIFAFARASEPYNAGTVVFDYSCELDLGGRMRVNDAAGPNPGGLSGQVWIACDRSSGPHHGNIYVLCSLMPTTGDDALDIMFVRSLDDGLHWSTPLRINADPKSFTTWQWFGTMSVAPNGRIDVVWNDTRHGVNVNWSEVYYAWSVNGGATFTHGHPVTPLFNTAAGWPMQQKIGDYYEMVSFEQEALLAYAATFNGEQDVYFVRLGDCNGNGLHDSLDIAAGTSQDVNNNGLPDECEHLGDLNCDGATDLFDIDAFVIALVSPTGYADTFPGCDRTRADINGDDFINLFDVDPFAALLSSK